MALGPDSGVTAVHRVAEGTYGGHPNPVRGAADPEQCVFYPEKPSAIARFTSSTNGLTEYRSRAFGGLLTGRLLTVSFSGELWAVARDGSKLELTGAMGAWPLDVTAQADDEPFPGTIWVALFMQERIQVLEPVAAP